MEEELRESEERYRRLTETISDVIWTMDMNMKLTYVSPSETRQTGLTVEETLAQPIQSRLPPASLEYLAGVLREQLDLERTGHADPSRSVTLEAELYRKDGSTYWGELSTTFLRDSDGRPTGILGVTRDITERKRAEEALKQSEERLKDLVERLKLSQEVLSTPVVQIWDKMLALPLIGVIDDQRSQQIMETVLRKIVETQSELLIMDVTGVASMDTTVANHLIRTIQSASLLGAKCILTGIRPEVAQSVTALGLDMSKVIIRRDLQDGLRWALQQMGYGIQL
jgi:rsbT co-antagonist protein RsbR